MLSILLDIWVCLGIAATMGVIAGWLVWGRETKKIVATYRRRVADARANWEAVEERLTEALARASALEREQKSIQREWTQAQRAMQEKEEAWDEERRLLEETVRRLNQRLLVTDSKPQPSVGPRPKREVS